MLRERLAKYIPPKEEWTPVDEALYGVDDIYNVPEDKAKELREDAIRYSFRHHYEGNKFYHEYCKGRGVGPDDIKTEEDFKKIPLIPDTFFKDHPDIEKDRGKGFLEWLEKVYTGKFPKIELKKKKPSYDDVIEELVKENVYLTFSHGAAGKFSFIPRDWQSYARLQYSLANLLRMHPFTDISKLIPYTPKDSCILAFIPNPIRKTFNILLTMGEIIFPIYDESAKIFMPVMPSSTKAISGYKKGIKLKVIPLVLKLSKKKFFSNYAEFLKKQEKEEKKLIIVSLPSMLSSFMSYLEKEEIKFNFRDGIGAFGGGWKALEGGRIDVEEFRKKINKNFGVSEENFRDMLVMNELTVSFVECGEYYKHIPYFIQPYVLDEEMNPLPYGEYGRLAFLDPLANSYPGFIVTMIKVKMLERCPKCDKPGFVLDPTISGMAGSKPKGCGAAMVEVLRGMGE